MIRSDKQKSDVVIKWPRNWKRLNQIKRSGKCPSRGEPHRAKPNAIVALVDDGGDVMLVFRLKTVVRAAVLGPDNVHYDNGCYLIAKAGSVRRPRSGDPKHISTSVPWYGAIRYFEAKGNEPVWYQTGTLQPGDGSSTSPILWRPRKPLLKPYLANNLGKEIGAPEAGLVNRYRRWLGGGDQRFGHYRFLRAGRLFTDLFITGAHILVEAKMDTDRSTIRYGIGQLFDYRRFILRRPRLLLLLPTRPSKALCSLLGTVRVNCVWETTGGSFRDSAGGRFTFALRRA